MTPAQPAPDTAVTAASAVTADAPLLHWPTPPYACYGTNSFEYPYGLDCLVEGSNGQVRACRLLALDLEAGLAQIQAPPARTVMPLRFDLFRRLSLSEALQLQPGTQRKAGPAPDQQPQPTAPAALAFSAVFRDGTTFPGTSLGYIDAGTGWFLFVPLSAPDQVQRVFLPTAQLHSLHLGEQMVYAQTEAAGAAAIPLLSTPEQLLQALEQQARMPVLRIGAALTALGLISEAQLQLALEQQRADRSLALGELLVRNGILGRDDLRLALARKMGYPSVNLETFAFQPEALLHLPVALARKFNVLPLLLHHGALVVAADDPSARALLDELGFSIGKRVEAALAAGKLDAALINSVYRRFGLESPPGPADGADAVGVSRSDSLLASLEQEAQDDDAGTSAIEQSENSLVNLINSLIVEAHNQGASDIHIETAAGARKVRIRLRKDGRLTPYMELPPGYRTAIIRRIKVMCELDIAERRKPQDGKIDFARFVAGHRLELRVVTIPTTNGAEDVVLRLLTSARPLALEELGLTPENLARLQAAVQRPHGMVLCVGPTGSGKTTTLHSVLQHLNTPERKIWTAEDPVEITNPDLRQVQVNPKVDWTFAKALRAFLRADPDIIMVGEIRDQETAQMVIEASLTGHLVLSTLHTNSAPETVVRLLDMGMDPFNFADSLAAVLAQRLVRCLCPACRSSQVADPAWVDELLEDYLHGFGTAARPDKTALLQQWQQDYGCNGDLLLYSASGCPGCDQSGYKGRTGVHELLLVDAALRHLIQTRAPASQIAATAFAQGHFRNLRQDGILKVLQGLTDIDEVRAHCSH